MPVFNQFVQSSPGQIGPTALHQAGPIVEVEIEVPQALQQVLTSAKRPIPPARKGMALIDTGATFSAVDEGVMKALGVPSVGVIPTGTAGGKQMANQYPTKFTLKFGGASVNFESTRATGVNLAGQPYIALIGRDVLSNGILIYNGLTGSFSLAF